MHLVSSDGSVRCGYCIQVLCAGVLLRVAGAKTLSWQQWGGLVLLVVACGVEQWGSFDWSIGPEAWVMVGIMAMCSAGAGVTNQLLLQTRQTAGQCTAACSVQRAARSAQNG
jgi:hypothetical protein